MGKSWGHGEGSASPELPQSWEPAGTRRESTKALRMAVANAHGVGAGMAGNALIAYVVEHGLPSRAEREERQAARDEREATSSGQDTTAEVL